MKRLPRLFAGHGRMVIFGAIGLAVLSGLLIYRLGSLVGGLSSHELQAATQPVGWHGIYHQPLDLPLKLVRSVVFFLFPDHGQTLSRLPNVFFGGLAVICFGWLIRLWHGQRTAILVSCLFATSAWVLHVSRLASFDVLYLWALPTLLLTQLQLQRRPKRAIVFYGSLMLAGLILYIPGMVWFLLLAAYVERRSIVIGWRHFSAWWQRALYILAGTIWLPLLILRLTESSILRTWLGLPAHFPPVLTLLKQFVGVFVHLFLRGPAYPEVWLGRAAILDIFTLTACVLGIYFYARHFQVARARLLAAFFGLGVILICLGGPVGLSLLVPLLYLAAATGIAYLLRDWLKVFPFNPLARGLGLGLVILAVALSVTYNLRAYFLAWPHNTTTKAIFRYHR